MTKKRIFFVLILVMMPILISCSRIPNTEKSSKELEPETSVYKFLEKIDPEVYKNCKVLIGLNSNIFYEGDFAHPLTERAEVMVNGEKYIVQHPPVISVAEQKAHFCLHQREQ